MHALMSRPYILRTVRISVLQINMRAFRQELTTRDEYLATRFTKLSASGHDLTPFTQSEVRPIDRFVSPLEPLLIALDTGSICFTYCFRQQSDTRHPIRSETKRLFRLAPATFFDM